MTIACINNRCITVPDVNSCDFLGKSSPPETIIDASAYVDGLLPIPANSDFLVSRLHENARILAVDFKDANSRLNTLGRIATFVETNAKKRIPTLKEITPGDAHDLKMSDIADFYNRSKALKIALTPNEQSMLDYLLKNCALNQNNKDQYEAPSQQILIGISRSPMSRLATVTHELSHAIYFLDAQFRAKVAKTWDSLEPGEKRFIRGALMAGGYATGSRELIETEVSTYTIADPMSANGLATPFRVALEHCDQKLGLKECKDFWSYRGSVTDLLNKLHARYMDISVGIVPLLKRETPELVNKQQRTLDEISEAFNAGGLSSITSDEFARVVIASIQEELNKKN